MSMLTILASLFEWLFGRWLNHREADALPRAQAQQAKAEAAQASVRDSTDIRVQKDRETNNAELDKARSDVSGVDGLQRSNEDVAAAIAQANDRVR